MPDDLKNVIKEAGKELLRVVILAILPVAISSLESEGKIDFKVVLTVSLLALLRGIDKLMHEWGKVIDDSSISKGITRF